MSVYGNLVRESNEIDYMYNIIMKEASLFDNITAFIIDESYIEEGISFAQIKEGAKKLLEAIIEKINKFLSWIKDKVRGLFQKIKSKRKETNKTLLIEDKKRTLKDMYSELEKELQENSTNESSYLEESVTIPELKEFLRQPTRLGSNINDFISLCKNYIEYNDGENSIKYAKFVDYLESLKLAVNPILDAGDDSGYTYGDFIFRRFDAKIDALWDYCYHKTEVIEKELNDRLKYFKEELTKATNLNKNRVDTEQLNSKYDLINYAVNNDIDKEEISKKEIENINKRLPALQTAIVYMMDYCILVERTNQRCIDFYQKAKEI